MMFGLACLALLIEAAVGYPQWLVLRIGHPVIWIGKLISAVEQTWNIATLSFSQRRLNGTLALVVVLLVTASTAVFLLHLLSFVPAILGLLVLALIASSFLSQKSLYEHVDAVAVALEGDSLSDAQQAVSNIVGRDPNALDQPAIARAAIESLAESFSDGVVAPAFWLAVLGLPGIAIYKAINTVDSMIGHKSERYHAFGWAAARTDDWVNLPASRLAAGFILAAAALLPEGDWRGAWQATRRDAGKHRSPNAGWPEAAVAGALGLRLNGPRIYDGKEVNDAWMGDGRSNLLAQDVRMALSLYRIACVVQIATYATIAFALWLFT